MGKVGLTDGFRNLTPGAAQLLTIKKVVFDEKFDKINMTFADETGATCTQIYTLKTDNDKPNEVALGIFSTIAKCATNDFENRDIDPEELEGLQIIADVVEKEGTTKKGEKTTFTNLRNFKAVPTDDDDDEDIWD